VKNEKGGKRKLKYNGKLKEKRQIKKENCNSRRWKAKRNGRN
jgi:hypothetical protein